MNIYLEYKDEKSAKFWKINVEGDSHTVTYGKIGTNGQSKTKTFESIEKANKDAEKLIKAKTKKGYREIHEGEDTVLKQVTPMVNTSSIDVTFINQAEATNRFELEQYDLLGSIDYDTVLVIEGDITVEKDIDDDSIESLFFKNKRTTEAELIIVNGNLTIEGDLSIYGETGYPSLLILGDLYCDSLFSNDNIIHVSGDAHIRYLFYGNYNHGVIKVAGITHVPYLINSDHHSELNPSSKTILINRYNNYDDFFTYDYYAEDIPTIFVKGLAPDDELDFGKFIARVKTGKSPFKKGVKPSRVLVENEIKRLAKKNKSKEVLKELDLSEKKLQRLPAALFELETLEVLNLSENNLSVLPDEIGKLVHLKELDLSNTNLKKIPKTIQQLKHLEILNLNNCRNLESLPESIGQLKNLKVLNLRYCKKMESLPENIGELTGLQKLILNCFEGKVPESISKLINLVELDIGDMHSKGSEPINFPYWICELKGLKRLLAPSNKLKTLPDELSKLSKLEYLNLNRSLGFLEEVTDLSQLKNLKELRVTGGSIDSVFPKQEILQHFFKIKSLEILAFSDFDKVKQSVSLDAINKRKEELKDDPEKLANLESRITMESGYTGYAKRLNIIKNRNNPEKLEEEKQRITISNAKYYYQTRRHMMSEDFTGLEQLTNLKELDVRGVILGFLPEAFPKLKHVEKIRCYSNIFSQEDQAKLQALGIAVVR